MSGNLLIGLSPFLVLVGTILVLMIIEAVSRMRHDTAESPSANLAITSALGLLAAALAAVGLWVLGPDTLPELKLLAPYLLIDRFSLFFVVVLALGAALSVLLAGGYMPEHDLDRGEIYPLMMLSTLGAMTLAAAGDLMTLFLGLEIMSLAAYAMVAFRRDSPRSVEAGLKYFLLGSFATAVLLYGTAFLYGATGKTSLSAVGVQTAVIGYSNPQNSLLVAYEVSVPLLVIGITLVLFGMLFKISAVPFHMWTPDAYEGAPTPVTAFSAAVVKTAAFAMLLRVVMLALNDPKVASWGAGWPALLATLAVVTMTVGNLVAARQESVKRMLAYSSIAHAGTILVGVVAFARVPKEAVASVLFYLLTYVVSTIGAFGALILCGSRGAEAVSHDDIAGLGRRHPAVALAFSLFLLSLAGVPATAGFLGKLFLFRAAIDGDYIALTVIALINTVIAAYYYLRVLVYMYMREPSPGMPVARPMKSGYVTFALLVAALLVLALGLLPGRALAASMLAAGQ